MKKVVSLFMCFFVAAIFMGVGPLSVDANQKQSSFTSVEPVEANKLIKQKKNLLILDVRSAHELKEGKIKDSVLAPLWDIVKGRYEVPKGQPILVVCAVGGRSYAIGQYLRKKGYAEIYNLSGGMSGWKNAGLPVEY